MLRLVDISMPLVQRKVKDKKKSIYSGEGLLDA